MLLHVRLQAEISQLKSQLYQPTKTMVSDVTPLTEELTSRTENDLLSMMDDRPLDQQPLSGMSLEDLRHFPSNAYSGTRQQNGSVSTGRPQSYSELPSNDLVTAWSTTLAERDALNFSRTMSMDTP